MPKEKILKVKGGFEVNGSAEEADNLKNAIISKAMQDYQAHRGQKFRAKSYLWSAVVNIKDITTMQELERLADHFKAKYGFQCYQIAIHRDEGYTDEQGNTRINHHAHLEFVTLDEQTGKNNYQRNKITPKVLRQIQTETANILDMQRSEDVRKTGRKRIEPRVYGKLMNETIQKHKAEKQELEVENKKLKTEKKRLKIEKDNALERLEISYTTLDRAVKAFNILRSSELFTPQNTADLFLVAIAWRAVRKRWLIGLQSVLQIERLP
ncbi:hypothetical protein [Helicobacter heilmannii]|uniref:hypothetical protein n=1 Tax=Helicobacter heilmannii TaxID=35817 RepID=UPI00028AD44A|nr:hypothetical protein [Helicobacter heilmannii]BDQ27398.1 hypothetical protein ASB1_10740 [Helicobacter heilmannii]CCM73318.1 mobilization protein [Helicobacter heilmannii ASB1.4]